MNETPQTGSAPTHINAYIGHLTSVSVISTDILLHWYADNKRSLPWRGERDVYRVWVSEIILQQTRIQQGWDYYLRFIKAFPDVKALAEADEEQVLRVWQGLGYYSRARNMHAAAQSVMREHEGKFPSSYQQVRQLKGIVQ